MKGIGWSPLLRRQSLIAEFPPWHSRSHFLLAIAGIAESRHQAQRITDITHLPTLIGLLNCSGQRCMRGSRESCVSYKPVQLDLSNAVYAESTNIQTLPSIYSPERWAKGRTKLHMPPYVYSTGDPSNYLVLLL